MVKHKDSVDCYQGRNRSRKKSKPFGLVQVCIVWLSVCATKKVKPNNWCKGVLSVEFSQYGFGTVLEIAGEQDKVQLDDSPALFHCAVWEHYGFRVTYYNGGKRWWIKL